MKIIGIPLSSAELRKINGGTTPGTPGYGAWALACLALQDQSTEWMDNFESQEFNENWEQWNCTEFFESLHQE